jgi:septal ring factor EnvC (AmiA/AmiB activator)|tara:strand:- start:43 stop:636 length:594 start_codon:yes stop_codon:yes gene_type:complete
MIRTELRKWDKYVNKKEWKDFVNSLSKENYSTYQSFNSYRSHIVRTEKKMNKLKTQIMELKERQNEYYKKLTKVNSQIDHLRKEFNISISVSSWKKVPTDKHTYVLGTIQRSGKKTPFNLGNVKKVEQRLMDYYKTNYPQRKKFMNHNLDDRVGQKDFCDELNLLWEKYKPQIRKHIRKNPNMKSLRKSLDFFFPIP